MRIVVEAGRVGGAWLAGIGGCGIVELGDQLRQTGQRRLGQFPVIAIAGRLDLSRRCAAGQPPEGQRGHRALRQPREAPLQRDRRLRLGAADAVRTGVAVQSVADVDALLQAVGLNDAEVITAEVAWITTTVSVTNRNWSDVRVFLQRASSRFRLGTVTSNRTTRFEIPPGQLAEGGSVRVVAEVIGTFERIATDEVRVQSGLVIEWTIENALQYSTMVHYVRY